MGSQVNPDELEDGEILEGKAEGHDPKLETNESCHRADSEYGDHLCVLQSAHSSYGPPELSAQENTSSPGAPSPTKSVLAHFKNPLLQPEKRLVPQNTREARMHQISVQFIDRTSVMTPPRLKVIKPASPRQVKLLRESTLDLVSKCLLSPPSVVSLTARHSDLQRQRVEKLQAERQAVHRQEALEFALHGRTCAKDM